MSKFQKWVSFWGNAMGIAENCPARYGKDITLRYPLYVPFPGEALKLTFDNFCGTEDVVLSKVRVRYKGTNYSVLYQGTEEMRIPAGEKIVTDPLEISLEGKDMDRIEVSFYLGEITQMRSAVATSGPLSKGLYGNGDQTEAESFDNQISRETSYVYFLSNASVLTEEENRAIVCYGDSITSQAWPDYLALRCAKEGFKNTAIIRRAISGSRILRQYDCITYESYGWSGDKRFPHEVPTEGADAVIIHHGINDIIHPVGEETNIFRPMSDLPTVEELIEGLKRYIAQARSYGYKVYVGTLLPMGGWRTDAPFRQEIRHAYNEFIRTTDLIDGYIDFDKAVQNGEGSDYLIPEYDSGDHLHPGEKGHEKMAAAVPAELLK